MRAEEVVRVDPGPAGVTPAPCSSAGEPIHAVMVTGKDRARVPFAQNAIINFMAQTYANRHLLVINHGGHRFGVPAAFTERITQIALPTRLTLGAMRNLAFDHISPRGVWMQWDDDDWRHPTLMSQQYAVLKARGVDACFLRWQIKYAFVRNAGWSDVCTGGFAGTVMSRNFPELRYPHLDRSEDSVFGADLQRTYRHCDWDNPPEFYVRFIHGHNTWPEAHFALDRHLPDTWMMAAEAASYLRAILPLYASAAPARSC